ncbi:MAG TPA: type II toxin-antitoxin system RelE/ParE family toxin [Bacteroidia bacterium]|jgi:toxin ParE1/3/4|nr:type II toxin-antitoxin system RelE/ParE family toxin [Bacteroidia bacterium]
MAKYKFTRKAVEDISRIWEYTVETWSEKQADKYYSLLTDACSELAKNPQLGKTYFEVYPDLYGMLISKHIIFYRILSKSMIEITRIIHAEMDLKSKLEE